MESLTNLYNKLKAAVVGPVQTSATDIAKSTGLTPIATDKGVAETLGPAPETPGTTMTGGKKARKTRRARKSKKTRRH